MTSSKNSYFVIKINNLLAYFGCLIVSLHDFISLFGFFTFLIIISQIVSGVMLALSLIPEPMLIPTVREEEDSEDLYIDEFFWIHERGVDLLFIFSYVHLFRKLFLNVLEYENESAWKSGVFSFLIIQVVVFFGLVLCCTHLSEITLTIAANILHTFFFFKGKIYWWLFTDKQLNTDTVVRLAYLHYIAAFFLALLGLIHGIDIHYDWKNETSVDGLDNSMIWWEEALANELSHFLDLIIIITSFCFFLYKEPEPLSYEIFMWGDVGMSVDVRFYGVAPHWYFRPFMAWLIACPHHKTGIFGLIFFFFILFFQPNIHGIFENNYIKKINTIFKKKFNRKSFYAAKYINLELNVFHFFTYFFFLNCCFLTTSFLPYGRFYNRLGGNYGMLLAYIFVFVYLGFFIFRKPLFLESFVINLLQKIYINLNYSIKTI